ncbi:MAG: NAD-dependent epimerase/dehydratase family protein [Victivallales bacterium]|nr:NAD-dependent epimerase/dehydratase family protein [Victivallales bacterium]
MSAKVLIIGGTRFLGLAIAEPFILKGYEVYEMNRGTRAPTPGVTKQIVCDKSDRSAFAETLKRHYWDIVIDTILTDEDLRFVIDTLGGNVGHFIHTGSLGVYGEAAQIPTLESLPLSEYEGDEYVVFNYKIKQDQVLARAFQENAFPATILRMSYIYGAGDVPLDGWGGRQCCFFARLAKGETIPLPNDGRALLHPGHVKDLGRSFINAAERPETSIGQIYNVAGASALMLKNYVAIIADILGAPPNFEYAPIKDIVASFPDETNERGMKFVSQHMCASIEKAARDLDWRPEIPLRAGLRENIEWMNHENG